MYTVRKINKSDLDINDSAWDIAEIAEIKSVNWDEYSYAPVTLAKLLYSDFGLFVRMSTNEKPLLARKSEQNSMVCTDSCMELFIRPCSSDNRYINLEFNPFGTMYLGVRTGRFDCVHPEKDKEYFNVRSLVNEKEWVLQFCIPFEFINEIFGGYTKEMKGNLFKCGEDTENEHYVSFYPIESEKPDFHRPEYFGDFILE